MALLAFSRTRSNKSRIRKAAGLKYFLISIPFMILIFAFSYVPLSSWVYAFYKYDLGTRFFDLKNAEFLGLENFAKLFRENGEILRVLRNTLVMSMLGLLMSPVPAIFAILLNEIKSHKFRRLVQTTTTLPNFISWIIVFGVAFSMFSADGFVNTLLKALHLPVPELPLLGNGQAVWIFQLCIGLWKTLGWNAIVYIAAIAGIDAELYDAAKIDGARKLGEIWHVTVPGIAPTYMVLLLLGISNVLNNGFEQYFMFFNSLVSDRIEVLDYYVYKVGLLINDYSFSITIGMLKTLISIILLFCANCISKRIRGNSLI